MVDVAGMAVPGGGEDRPPKRRLSESDEQESVAVMKKLRESQPLPASAPASQLVSDSNLNFPLPWETGTACLVKVCPPSSFALLSWSHCAGL